MAAFSSRIVEKCCKREVCPAVVEHPKSGFLAKKLVLTTFLGGYVTKKSWKSKKVRTKARRFKSLEFFDVKNIHHRALNFDGNGKLSGCSWAPKKAFFRQESGVNDLSRRVCFKKKLKKWPKSEISSRQFWGFKPPNLPGSELWLDVK